MPSHASHASLSAPLLSGDTPHDPPPAYPGPPPTTNTTSSTTNPTTSNPTTTSILPTRPPPPRAPLSLPIIHHLRTHRVILASNSPRRLHLLTILLGPSPPKIEVHVSQFSETLDKSIHTPYSYVLATAHGKCLDVYTRLLLEKEGAGIGDGGVKKTSEDCSTTTKDGISSQAQDESEPAVVIAADTIIVRTPTGTILEKPTSRANHISTLTQLVADGSHSVFTAVVCMAPRPDAKYPGYRVRSKVVETVVSFDKSVSREMVEAYVDTREGVDKAGGYALQGLGAVLVEKVVGSWDNVVGLPLRETLKCLEGVVRLDGNGFLDEDSSDGEEDEEEE